ncbi:hypothetical protein FHS43_000228 [Streptosporangium becharense]|uniref:DUF11 domain-containing protein n=1 Tax=Streptosporangium becharense TaxID=1816182 RepID=A0A7W9MGN2_9ACTN|nr:DUF11 domain-containing protein [Streptosporangium becharense]MBB2908982.1 hypothetical protein [Streptosporangium becharense]MBB5820000.1 hypothetical protein [Streptosporangium becharense]
MRHPISRIAALTLAASLAGGVLFAAPASAAPAQAPVQAPASAVKTADEPYSSFKVSISAPKKVRAGGKITYTVKAVNGGPHLADTFYMGGALPKNSKITAIYGPKGSECDVYDDGFWCWYPRAIKVGEQATLRITVKLTNRARGTAEAILGVDAYDLPNGAENLSRDEYERLGIKSWYFVKKAKTKIVR